MSVAMSRSERVVVVYASLLDKVKSGERVKVCAYFECHPVEEMADT